jgi:hypothetical protein
VDYSDKPKNERSLPDLGLYIRQSVRPRDLEKHGGSSFYYAGRLNPSLTRLYSSQLKAFKVSHYS